jgi:serine/threonine protein kinase
VNDSQSGEDLVDRVVEMVMRGQDPDIEQMIASTPDLSAETRDKLRKVAGAFGSGTPALPVLLPREGALPFAELGSYKLVSRMGEGGMGMVYLAEHKFLRRRVALKLIRPELALSEVTRQRFHREAMSIAKLRHENIVSVYDAGEHDGVAFLAMELVEGQGLDELLLAERQAGRRMEIAAAVRHARGIALALQCAHEAGIIHRDVKPSNVRITPDGRELLLDFGLSLAEEVASRTSFGQFRGTPQYASPEQIEPGSTDIDARTDVYSLGIMLYECLTGETPFAGGNMYQLFHQILTRDPIEPRKLNELIDASLDGIVMRSIAKRREDRFGSAKEMARALEGWLERLERPEPSESSMHADLPEHAAQPGPAARSENSARSKHAEEPERSARPMHADQAKRSAPSMHAERAEGIEGSTHAAESRDLDPSMHAERRGQLELDERTGRAHDALRASPALGAPRMRVTKITAIAVIVLALGGVAWFALRGGDRAADSPPTSARPVVLSVPRRTIELFGASNLAFDRRLDDWAPLVGTGVFGADPDGSGVIGTSVEGITAKPREIPSGSGRVRGSIEPIPLKPGERTRAAGAGVELSDGRIVALLLVSADADYDIRLCEIVRDGESRWTRGAELAAATERWSGGAPLAFELKWNDTDAQFDWRRAGAPERDDPLFVPRAWRGSAQPSRFVLLVETGSARFEEWVLEES